MALVKTVCGKLLQIIKSHCDGNAPVFTSASVDCIFFSNITKKIKQTRATIKRGQKRVNDSQFVSDPVLHLYKYTHVFCLLILE